MFNKHSSVQYTELRLTIGVRDDKFRGPPNEWGRGWATYGLDGEIFKFRPSEHDFLHFGLDFFFEAGYFNQIFSILENKLRDLTVGILMIGTFASHESEVYHFCSQHTLHRLTDEWPSLRSKSIYIAIVLKSLILLYIANMFKLIIR